MFVRVMFTHTSFKSLSGLLFQFGTLFNGVGVNPAGQGN